MHFKTTIGVELRGAAKTYRNAETAVHAVRGIDVSIAPGETVALLGPNGAGKSTTIDMLLGLISPDSGSVSLVGRPPTETVAGGMVGAMLHAGALIRDVRMRELTAMMAALYPHPLAVGEALELAGLTEIAGRRTHKLSGGQAQRVRFAIALVPDPSVLILDEPTVGLDVEARRAFYLSVREFAARRKTIVFATHYMEEAHAFAKNRHPAIRFSSTRVSDAGDGHLSVIGELHAGGGQVTLTLRPALWQVGDRLHVDASVTVDQREPAHALQPVGTLSRNKPVTADDCIPTAVPGISPQERDVDEDHRC